MSLLQFDYERYKHSFKTSSLRFAKRGRGWGYLRLKKTTPTKNPPKNYELKKF